METRGATKIGGMNNNMIEEDHFSEVQRFRPQMLQHHNGPDAGLQGRVEQTPKLALA